MKILLPVFNSPMHLLNDRVNSLVIENQACFFEFVNDMQEQLNKKGGNIVLSEQGKILDISKSVELITQYVPFDINRKSLVSRLQKDICDKTVQMMQPQTSLEIANMVKLLYDVMDLEDYDLQMDDIEIGTLLKCVNVRFANEYKSLTEEMYQYCKAASEFEGTQLFIFVNLRSFVSNKDFGLLSKTMIDHGLLALFVDNREYKRENGENRVVVDEDLCII